jgi:uncharacterized membrane protein
MPLHPLISHFPLVLSFLVPIMIFVFAFLIRANRIAPSMWLIVVGFMLTLTVSGYVALETGETEEDKVEKVMSKKIIHEHEEAAEIFVGSTVIILALGIAAFFLRKELQYPIMLAIGGLALISAYLGFRTGKLGGELVYIHGAASAYTENVSTSSLLPTPGMNTSESPMPTNDENETLKTDDHDYGNASEASGDDEELKQED